MTSTAAHVQIAPSVLAADFGCLAQQVKDAEAAGADLIHVDVMDGRFVPNISFGEVVVDAIRGATSLPLNIHLMVHEPDRLLPGLVKDINDQVLVHAEACAHLHRTVGYIKEQGCQVGVAINPATPIAAVEEVLPDLDIVLVMTVNPGFGGQSFIPSALGKLRRLHRAIADNGFSVQLEVDGGIKADATARDSVGAGAGILVAGSAIFNREQSVAEAIGTLRGAISGMSPGNA
jgi:ribulose-phosphate 3-epimerase